MTSNKLILVTGANGYIGSNVYNYLISKNYKTIRHFKNKNDYSKLGHKEDLYGDLSNEHIKLNIPNQVTHVIHIAGNTNMKAPLNSHVRDNYLATKNLINAIEFSEGRAIQFIYLSSDAVLHQKGKKIGFENDTKPHKNIGPYSYSKSMAEDFVLDSSSENFISQIIRTRLVWGGDNCNFQASLKEKIKENKFIWISGGNYITSSCNILRLCKGIEQVLNKTISKEIYHIVDEKPVYYKAFVKERLKNLNVSIPKRSIPLWALLLIVNILSLTKNAPISKESLLLLGKEFILDDTVTQDKLG